MRITAWHEIGTASILLADGGGRRAFSREGFHNAPMRTSFKRPDAPLLIDTADLRHAKRVATSAISSSFALPSTGAALSCASHVPSSACSSVLSRELGLTLTRMTIGGVATIGDTSIRQAEP